MSTWFAAFVATGILFAALAAAASPADPKRLGPGKIAFVSDEVDPAGDIWTMNPDGSGRTNLTPGRVGSDIQPDWSPDGAQIVFTSVLSDGNQDVFVMDADGGDIHRLTSDPAPDSLPAWSPDGTQIIFRSGRTGNSEVFVMDADGSGLQQLTDHPGFDAHPQFSPAGNKIAFDRRDPVTFEDAAIYTMRADGSHVQQLTEDSLHALDPDWTSRGNRLVFINGFCSVCPFNEVVTMKANGNDVVQLTFDQDIGAFNFSPGWSPDGRQIVFEHVPDASFPPSDIHVMNRDGSGRTNITQTPEVTEFLPDWGPSAS